MLPHSLDCVPAETMKKLIDRVWRRHYETVLTRVDLLERTATAIIQESLTPQLLDEALSACHKLAGALGSFGYHEGTQLARKLEQQLASTMPDAVGILDSVRRLRLVLSCEEPERPGGGN